MIQNFGGRKFWQNNSQKIGRNVLANAQNCQCAQNNNYMHQLLPVKLNHRVLTWRVIK